MPRSSSYSHHKSSRSYSRDRDRDYKKRSSSDDDYYDRKKSHRRSRSPSSSSRSKLSYRSSRRRSNSSSDNDYYRKKRSSKTHKDKKSKKSKRSHRSPSTSSRSSIESKGSTKSSKSIKQQKFKPSPPTILENESESKPIIDLNLLEGKITSETLEDIESDKFQSKTFTSSGTTKQTSQKVYIDLKKETILVPTSNDNPTQVNDSLFHPNFLGDEVEKSEKWIKKLFNFRQRLLQSS